MIYGASASQVITGSVLIVVGAVGLYVTRQLYRLAMRVLRDPDTERLLDGE